MLRQVFLLGRDEDMATFGSIYPGDAFVKAIDGGVTEINKIYFKDSVPAPAGSRSGMAVSYWITSISDAGIEILPTGELAEHFGVDQSVVAFGKHGE
jgi:hypothetical protein